MNNPESVDFIKISRLAYLIEQWEINHKKMKEKFPTIEAFLGLDGGEGYPGIKAIFNPEKYKYDSHHYDPQTGGTIVSIKLVDSDTLIYGFSGTNIGTSNAMNDFFADVMILVGINPQSVSPSLTKYLNDIIKNNPEFSMFITGHSLGNGLGGIEELNLIYRLSDLMEHPEVIC